MLLRLVIITTLNSVVRSARYSAYCQGCQISHELGGLRRKGEEGGSRGSRGERREVKGGQRYTEA